MRLLVLGGMGFLGRHVVRALTARGHAVAIGSRRAAPLPALQDATGVGRGPALPVRRVRLQHYARGAANDALLREVDVVVNCVGILRERWRETYDAVHHRGPALLAADCARLGVRLVHVSALGLRADARSRFIRSKWQGETAIKASGAVWTIVRPSLLEGDGGYGARWLRALARLPLHCVPARALGRIAVVDVAEAGVAIAAICERAVQAGSPGGSEVHPGGREIEIGGPHALRMHEVLAALRQREGRAPAPVVRLPYLLARMVSHLCDFAHLSPFSFGHLELLERDNVPRDNALPRLLGRVPRALADRVPPVHRDGPVGEGAPAAAPVHIVGAGAPRQRPRVMP